MTVEAHWHGAVIARSDDTVLVEGNHYFPRDSVDEALVSTSDHTSVCPWKGTASYLSLTVDGETNTDAAWYYPEPKDKAEHIKNHVAFWNGVEVREAQ